MLALQLLLARLMPLDGYGSFVTLWTWMLAVGSFGTLGFAETSVRFVPRYLARDRRQAVGAFFRYGFAMAFLGSTLLALAILGLASFLADDAALIAALVGFGLPFLAIEYYLAGIGRAFGWFQLITIPVFIVRPLLIGAGALALHQLGIPLTLRVVGTLVVLSMATITILLAVILTWRLTGWRREAASTRSNSRLWLRASLPLVIVSGLDDLVFYADVLTVSLLLPPEDVGLYFAAARVLALANFIYYAMYLVAGRRFALDLASRDAELLQSSLIQSSRLTFWLTTLAVLATLVGGPLILAAFGEAFEGAFGVMAVLGLGTVVRAMAGQAGELLVVAGKQREAMRLFGLTLAVGIVLSLVLTPLFGITGAAAASAGAMAARTLLLASTVWRTSRLRIVSLGLPRFA